MEKLFSIIIGISFVMGCAQSYNPNIQRGSNYEFRDGYPQVQFSATEIIYSENNPVIDIAAEIEYESLIFKKSNDQAKAKIAVDVRITNQDERVLNENNYSIEIDSSSINKSSQSHLITKQLEAPPGDHKIYFTVTDQNTDKHTTRTANISVPDPTKDDINLTNIKMLGKNSEAKSSWNPINTYDIPSRIDSLIFRFQVSNSSSGEPLSINAKLLKIKSDNSVAQPTFFRNHSSSRIEYRGINYDDKRIIQESTRKITENGNIFIEFRFDQFERGNYRFEVQVQKNDEIFKARDFGVKSKNYPFLKSPQELARPLIYVMDGDNYEDLLSIKDPDSLKIAVDKFWIREVGNEKEAQQVLEKYYTRVEEANKQFSNFKEGWKTDPGMIYILFGRPDFARSTMNTAIWNYSKNVVTSPRTFVFNKPKVNNASYPFNHYLLQRKESYYSLVYQQKQLWHSDLILERDF